jgi:hypothetical protein
MEKREKLNNWNNGITVKQNMELLDSSSSSWIKDKLFHQPEKEPDFRDILVHSVKFSTSQQRPLLQFTYDFRPFKGTVSRDILFILEV